MAHRPSPCTFLFAEATPEKLLQHAWLRPHWVTGDGRVISSLHAFIIKSEGSRIIVDTCVGNDKPRTVRNWNMRKGHFSAAFAAPAFIP